MTKLRSLAPWAIAVLASLGGCSGEKARAQEGAPQAAEPTEAPATGIAVATRKGPAAPAPAPAQDLPKPKPIEPFVEKAIGWLVDAQHEDGGWGAGSHASQQQRDARKVKTDPATTAFSALALMRVGNTPVKGVHKEAVLRATKYLLGVVAAASTEGPKITDLQGTQPQAKMGMFVDTSMTAQFLARVLTALPEKHELRARVDRALDKCLRKLEGSQQKDGSWQGGGSWAPVLQSSLNCTAFELAYAAGKQIDMEKLALARNYQQRNVDGDGRARADKAAGVELYALASGSRGMAGQSRAADEIVARGKLEGKLSEDADVSQETLQDLGVDAPKAAELAVAYRKVRTSLARFDSEEVLKGFGSNGGEEYLSYMMNSEALVIVGGEEWDKWRDKMHARLKKVQTKDGSWTGHHCITSPVFCTAAVIQCLTADYDAPILLAISAKDEAGATKQK
ncbi:MAG: hypothetical protein O7C98_01560 [Planctomycetota bacterium]|nr:hypothetical protein [Planctomycetota bacterium]